MRYELLDANMHERRVSGDSGDGDIEQGPPLHTKGFSFASSSIFPTHSAPPALHTREVSWSSVTEPILGRVAIRQVHLLPWLRRRQALRQSRDSEKSGPSPDSDVGAHPSADLDPPIKLLSRCHTLCVIMTGLGFILAVTGILAYAWTNLPRSVSIFASACVAGCVLIVVMVLDL